MGGNRRGGGDEGLQHAMQQAIAECIYARRFLAAMTILGVASGSGTLGAQRRTGRRYGSGAGSEPETHPKVSFAACVDAVLLFAAPPMYGSTAAPLLQVLPRFASPPTPLSRTPASYVWRIASPPTWLLQVLPHPARFASPPTLLLQVLPHPARCAVFPPQHRSAAHRPVTFGVLLLPQHGCCRCCPTPLVALCFRRQPAHPMYGSTAVAFCIFIMTYDIFQAQQLLCWAV